MTLQDVASAKSVLAEMALVGPLAGVCVMLEAERGYVEAKLTAQQMTLEMLQVQVRLVAVRTLVFALGILGGSCGSLACSGCGPTGVRGQDSATTLLTDDVNGFGLLVGEYGRVGVHGRVSQSHARRAAELVAVGMRRCCGQHRRLRISRRHGHVRTRRGLEGSQRRVLQRRHGRTAIGGRGHRRVRRLGRVRVAIVAVHGRVLAGAL